MKVSAPFAVALALSLAGGCASPSRLAPMPDYTITEADVVEAAATPARLVDDQDDEDAMRVPTPDEPPPEIWPARGLYIGGSLIASQPLGDFEGDQFLSGPTDLILIPDLDVGAGFGGYIAYRWYMNELQLQYSITEHDGDFEGSPQEHDTTFYDLDVNWRHYFWPKSPLQPYGLLGMGWGRAKIENGSTDQATGTVFEDAELKDGINFNVGVGAALYTLPWVTFHGQAMYRFVRYEKSDGIDGNFSNIGDVDGDGWNLSVGAAFRLLPGRKASSHYRNQPK